MTISDHVRRLRALPSTTDDRRGRRLRQAAGNLLAHGEMYHGGSTGIAMHCLHDRLNCRLCFAFLMGVHNAMRPTTLRATQLALEDYSPITSADW